MANLVSPGVQVQIIDESFYAGAGPGTVPFIMMATAQDKAQPGNTTAIAPGTVQANAGKLVLVSSQRELIQTFGNPVFKTQGGTPQYGSELNEWGLYAAYQYLGLANRAYVMRADMDLTALESSAQPPAGEPKNGSYWLDTVSSVWGMFRSNGNINSSLSWGALRPIVINDAAQLELSVTSTLDVLDPNDANAVNAAGTLHINDVEVVIDNTESLLQIAQKINTAIESNPIISKRVLSAQVIATVKTYGTPVRDVATIYNLRIVSSDVDIVDGIDFGGSTGSVVSELGLDASVPVVTPVANLGSTGSVAVNAYKSVQGITVQTQVQMYEKILITTDDVTEARWFLIGSPAWQAATPTQVTAVRLNNPLPFPAVGADALVQIGATSFTFTNNSTTLSGLVTELNTEFASQGVNAHATIYNQGPNAFLRITNYDGTLIKLIDRTAALFTNLGMTVSQQFYQEVVGTTDVPLSGPYFNADARLVITVGNSTASVDPQGGGLTDLRDKINQSTLGTQGLITASVVNSGANNFLKIAGANGTFFTLSNNLVDPEVPAITELCGIDVGTTYGNSLVFKGYTQSLPQPKTQAELAAGNIWINTVAANRGSAWSVKRYNSGTQTWQTRAAPLYSDDSVANAAYGGQRQTGSVYVQYDSELTTPDTATFVVKAWTGTTWAQIKDWQVSSVNVGYTQSATTPVGAPEANALWFNQDLRVDIMVNEGTQWMGYRQMYPDTDVNGPQLQATAPSYQSDGFSALVDQDIWIDTSDLENYPKIYRWDSLNLVWNLVDNSDQTTSQGIVFADARQDNGSGSEAPSDMVLSDNVDSDAPDPILYPVGMLLFNTRYSTNNVKSWQPNQLGAGVGRWVTVSGLQTDGSPYMGRKAQRRMVVQAMASAIASNQDIRAEGNFFNLLCAPGYPELLDELVVLNTDKKDPAFIVVDTPARLTPDGTSIQSWANNTLNVASNGELGITTRSRYAGVYYPWGLATNLDGNEVFVPASVAVLRTIAFNDQVAYPWFAPAGLNRGLVSVLTSVGYLNGEQEYVPVQLSQGQSDILYENDINPIRFVPGRGLVIYGQKTLSPVESALNRVNVARLVNYLNVQLDNLAKPFLFEPNDEYTRDAVTRTFESFLGDLIAQRALFDFAVLCDDTNNTPDRIDRNELWIDIAVKPIKAVEFIYIPVRILNTGDPLPT